MRRRHIPSVLRIEAKVYPRPWSAGLFLSELSQKENRAYFVARNNARVIGYCGMMLLAGEAHITNIAVDPDYQRFKIGTKMMLALLEDACDRGATASTLEVRRTNLAAQEMYRQFGFETVGVRRGYYVETGEDAFVMWADGIWTRDFRERLESIRKSL